MGVAEKPTGTTLEPTIALHGQAERSARPGTVELKGKQFGLIMRNTFKIVNILLVAVALVAVSENAWSHPEDDSLVEEALHALEEQGEITEAMHTVFDQMYENGNADKLAHYLDSLAKRGEITSDTHVYLETVLRAGVPEEGSGLTTAAPASYTGNGNVTLLGTLNPRAPFSYYGDNSSTGQLYEGIWGYASGGREYALLAHSQGLSIIEVTDPINPVELQFIPSAGGRVHRDVDTYYDSGSGKTYAYFGGQEGANLYSIDLSYLWSTIPPSGIVDLGRTNWTHTLQVSDGLLFANSAGSSLGCQVFDLQANPSNPPLLMPDWSGPSRDCHDSFTRDNILYSADGYSTRWRIADITGIRGGSDPTLLAQTDVKSGMYAHSVWLSDDSQYLYAFEESNIEDINVFDVSDPTNPVNVTAFQWSGDPTGNSIVHNGQVRGDLLHVAYYEAGFRVFDILDPANPIEVGMYETWRDPDGDGTFDKSITGAYNGAWNVYTGLPSGYVLVSDMRSGLFVFQITAPSPPPPPPPVAYNLAAADFTTTRGTVSGTYMDTHAQDDVYQVLTEEQQGRNSRKARSLADHTWTFDVSSGTAYQFMVDAYHSPNAEGDDYRFSYSLDGVVFAPMLTVTKTADDDSEQTFEFPEDVAGEVYVRVEDTNRSQGNNSLDTVYVDWMSIMTVNGGADVFPPAPPAGLTATGADGSVSLDWVDSSESDLDGYEVYRSQTSAGPYTKLTASLLSASLYQDTAVVNGTTYFYVITAVDLTANESNPSTEASATPTQQGVPSSMHVASVVTSTFSAGQGQKRGQAVATIVNNLGDPVGLAMVTGVFSGTFSESDSGLTGQDGAATITTAGQVKGKVSFTFCVSAVTLASLTYVPADNSGGVATCVP